MTQVGDGDDDERAMRAVWRSMPDEDPPARGLAELMAAARVKAETLARPPWWRRLLELLRRPTVLALASILVLIGGAVLVTKHKEIETAPAFEPAPARQIMQGSGAAEVKGAPGMVDKQEAAPAAEATTTPVPATPPRTSPPISAPHVDTPRPAVAPSHAVGNHAASPARTPAPPTQKLDGVAAPEPVAPPPPKEARSAADEDDDAEIAGTRGPTKKQVLVDELLQQSRSAATRGDCETAKLIAKRIANQDASYYREHVSNDAAISKCFAAQ